tara:strand:- start:809 stop:1267 length:459 start_codon:yes stop_codon:yes gene_type:complete
MKLLLENWRKHLKEGQEDEFLEMAREGIASLKEKFPNVIATIDDDVLEQAAAEQIKHQADAGGPGGWSDRDKEYLLLRMLERAAAQIAGSSGEDDEADEDADEAPPPFKASWDTDRFDPRVRQQQVGALRKKLDDDRAEHEKRKARRDKRGW